MKQTIIFKDEGQDFLEWDIEYPEGDDIIGKVIACRPFQSEVWVGVEVYRRDIRPGDLLPIVSRVTGKPLTLKHPVETVSDCEAIRHNQNA